MIKPTQKMVEAGNEMASTLYDVSIDKSLSDVPVDTTPYDNADLLDMYLNGECDSVTVIYIAMERKRE